MHRLLPAAIVLAAGACGPDVGTDDADATSSGTSSDDGSGATMSTGVDSSGGPIAGTTETGEATSSESPSCSMRGQMPAQRNALPANETSTFG